MQEFKHLLVGSDNILCRNIKGKDDKQVVLPSRLKPLVYIELHENFGHLAFWRGLIIFNNNIMCCKCHSFGSNVEGNDTVITLIKYLNHESVGVLIRCCNCIITALTTGTC